MDAFNVVAPGAEFDAAIFQGDGNASGLLGEEVFNFPFDCLFRLGAVVGKNLSKIAFAVEKRNGNHGEADIRCGANGVAGENAEAAGIARHGVLQRNFHRKIGNQTFSRRQCNRVQAAGLEPSLRALRSVGHGTFTPATSLRLTPHTRWIYHFAVFRADRQGGLAQGVSRISRRVRMGQKQERPGTISHPGPCGEPSVQAAICLVNGTVDLISILRGRATAATGAVISSTPL